MKNIQILSEIFHFLVVKFSVYFNRRVIVMSKDLSDCAYAQADLHWEHVQSCRECCAQLNFSSHTFCTFCFNLLPSFMINDLP